MSERRHPATGRPLMYSVEERRERHRTRTERYKKRDRLKNRLELFEKLIHHCDIEARNQKNGAETQTEWIRRGNWLKEEKQREQVQDP